MARSRAFDVNTAIEKATTLFWQNGYDRTSLADLTASIGIKPPSFYFAFGSKDGLFRQVLGRYYDTYLGYAEEALKERTSRRVAEVMLYRLAEIYTDPSHPPGCLAVRCAMSGSQTGEAGDSRHLELRAARRARLRQRLEEAVASGDLPPETDPEELARYLLTIGWGMAVDAQSGTSREDLYRTVARALQAWPA